MINIIDTYTPNWYELILSRNELVAALVNVLKRIDYTLKSYNLMKVVMSIRPTDTRTFGHTVRITYSSNSHYIFRIYWKFKGKFNDVIGLSIDKAEYKYIDITELCKLIKSGII